MSYPVESSPIEDEQQPVPTDRYPQDERLERLEDYLLGLLPEAEAEQLDELSITDEEFAWQLRAAEDDLVDAYVRDSLPATTRARFEEYYLASPRHRERVTFARSLARTADRAVDRPAAMADLTHQSDTSSRARDRASGRAIADRVVAHGRRRGRRGRVWRDADADRPAATERGHARADRRRDGTRARGERTTGDARAAGDHADRSPRHRPRPIARRRRRS